ncbi:MAG: energy transducer TonB [Bryobacteraceae bacterium]|nr:energy transducer TonB [Bryobacteraceae bacterium]
MSLRIPLILLSTSVLFAQNSLTDEGGRLIQQGHSTQAVEVLRKAVQANPNDARAHQYLGVAYMQNFTPGQMNAENSEWARMAGVEFQAGLALQPDNIELMRNLATLNFHQGMSSASESDKPRFLDEASYWHNKIVSTRPDDKEGHYGLGVIAWSKAYSARMKVRQQLGMGPGDPGPLPDANLRVSLRSQNGTLIDEGIRHLQTSVRIDRRYDDAMAYLNLLYRERADLADDSTQYQQDIRLADAMVNQALDIKRTKALESANSADPGQLRIGRGMPAAPPPAQRAGVIGGFISAAPLQPPPPPPPGTYLVPSQIRVGGNVQAAKLVRKVEPVYPPLAMQARIQGVVRFNVVTGKDGRISNMTLVSGHPLLVPSATESVRQYEYQPTLLNGQPVEVVTQVDVNFTLSQ